MSGLALFLRPDSITFTIDTLETKNDSFPMVKMGVISKMNFYPHLKCCVVAFGTTRLGRDYHKFINSLVLSDIVDLVDLTNKYFLDLIDADSYSVEMYKNREDANTLGDLYVMGYSDKSSKMCCYIITVKRDSVSFREMRMDVRKYIHPPIKEEDENRILEETKKIEGAGVEHVLIQYMEQMAKDSESEETFTVGVGMEIQLVNLLVIEGNFFCSFTTVKRFEDFDENLKRMAEAQEEILIYRTKRNREKKLKTKGSIEDKLKVLTKAKELKDRIDILEVNNPEIKGTWSEIADLFNMRFNMR